MVEEGSGRPRRGRSEHRRCHSLAVGGLLVPADAVESVVVSERVVPVGLRLPARLPARWFLVRKLGVWGGGGRRTTGWTGGGSRDLAGRVGILGAAGWRGAVSKEL